jgi:hypothetical protein
MSNRFDTDAYVSRWDNILIPVMLVIIFGSMVGAYALNVMARPDCTTHDYVFCGTPLDEPDSEEVHHSSPGDDEQGAAGHGENTPHSPAGGEGHEHGGAGNPH